MKERVGLMFQIVTLRLIIVMLRLENVALRAERTVLRFLLQYLSRGSYMETDDWRRLETSDQERYCESCSREEGHDVFHLPPVCPEK